MKNLKFLAALLLLLPLSQVAKADLCMDPTTHAYITCSATTSSGTTSTTTSIVGSGSYVQCANGASGAADLALLATAAALGGNITLSANCTINAPITLLSNTIFNGNGYTITAASAANWSGSVVRHAFTSDNTSNITIENTNFDWSATTSGSIHIIDFAVGNSKIQILNNTSTGAGDFVAFIGSTDVSEIGNRAYMCTNACFDHWNGAGYIKVIGNTASTTTAAVSSSGILITGFNTNNSAGTQMPFFVIADNNILLNGQAVAGQLGVWLEGYASTYAGLLTEEGSVHDNTCTVAAGVWAECIRGTGYIANIDVHDNAIWADGTTTSSLPAIEINGGGPTNIYIHDNHANGWKGQTAGTDRGVFTNKATNGTLINNTCMGTCSSPTEFVNTSTTIQQYGDPLGTGTTTFTSPVAFPAGATGDLYAGVGAEIGWTGRGVMTSPAANQIRFGSADSATPSSQQLFTQGSRGGTDSNVAGGNLTIHSGQGTGSGTGSTLVLDTPLALGSGTTLQTLYPALQLGSTLIYLGNTNSNPDFTFRGSGTISGTPVTSLFASPPAIGGSAAAAGAFTTLSSTSAITTTSTGAGNLGAGTTAQRPAGTNGMCRYNSTFGYEECYNNSTWRPIGGVAVVPGCASGAALTHTGDTAETNLAVCTIPAAMVCANCALRVTEYTSRAATTTNTVNYTVRWSASSGDVAAGTVLQNFNNATSAAVGQNCQSVVFNANATGAQVAIGNAQSTCSFSGAAIGSAGTGVLDTTATTYVNFNCKDTTSSGDTCGYKSWMVELISP